jgi:hypothetical protein
MRFVDEHKAIVDYLRHEARFWSEEAIRVEHNQLAKVSALAREDVAEMKDVIVTIKTLRGYIARWAVQQSPYAHGPEGLDTVLSVVTDRFKSSGDLESMYGTSYLRLTATRDVVQSYLRGLLFDIPQVQAWNERKNKREGYGVVTVYDGEDERDPDDDFIDLDALVQNIATSLLRERV